MSYELLVEVTRNGTVESRHFGAPSCVIIRETLWKAGETSKVWYFHALL